MNWPADRFEVFFHSWMMRTKVEELKHRKDAIVSALHANSNVDVAKLPEVLEKIEEDFQHQCNLVYNPALRKREEQKIAEISPFFAAGSANLPKVDHFGGAKEVIDEEEYAKTQIDWSAVEVDQL